MPQSRRGQKAKSLVKGGPVRNLRVHTTNATWNRKKLASSSRSHSSNGETKKQKLDKLRKRRQKQAQLDNEKPQASSTKFRHNGTGRVGQRSGNGSSSSAATTPKTVVVDDEHKVRLTSVHQALGNFSVGDIVEVSVDGGWQHAVIDKVLQNGCFDVVYDDGVLEQRVARKDIRQRVYTF